MTVKVPATGDPLIREFFLAVNEQRGVLKDLARRAGVYPQTVRNWRRRSPKLKDFTAMLDLLDLELMILPKAKAFTED